MKTIVILSDSHGSRSAFKSLEVVLKECDYIFHLGDYSSDGAYLKSLYPDKTVVINGNCELRSVGLDEACIEVEGVKIFLCHGHKYSVKTTLLPLAKRAKELACTLAAYGHTHTPAEDEIDGVTLFNPGSVSDFGAKSYGYAVISGQRAIVKSVPLD